MGRNALPASIAKPPIIGVAAGPLGTICLLVAGAPVDDGEIAKDTDDHVVLADVLDRGASTNLRKKGLAGENAAYFTLGGNVYPFEITLCDLVRSWSAPPRQPAAPRTEPW